MLEIPLIALLLGALYLGYRYHEWLVGRLHAKVVVLSAEARDAKLVAAAEMAASSQIAVARKTTAVSKQVIAGHRYTPAASPNADFGEILKQIERTSHGREALLVPDLLDGRGVSACRPDGLRVGSGGPDRSACRRSRPCIRRRSIGTYAGCRAVSKP